jgi:peptidoglycan/LPS O-acetylase OafA/YrhL
MFGIFRFILAIFVVVAHIAKPDYGLSIIGSFAVYGFFILSGYLMTLVTNKRYGFTADGIKKFLLNRFLRIYPTYWLSILISIVLLLLYGQPDLQQFNDKIKFPDSWYDILSNILIFGLARTGFFELPDTILSPPAWALEIELTFYIAIGLGLGKRKFAVPWLIFTCGSIVLARIGCAILSKINQQAYGFSYGSLLYASLAFVAGSLIFHYQEQIIQYIELLKRRFYLKNSIVLLVIIGLFFANAILSTTVTRSFAFVLNTILMILIIMFLLGVTLDKYKILSSLDRILGGISYPIYLLHYQIAFLVSKYLPGVPEKGWPLFCWSLPFIILGSLLIHLTFEKQIENLRSSVRTSTS